MNTRHGVNTGISILPPVPGIVSLYDEYEACIQANLDLWRWEQGQYPREFMARVVGWHWAHQLVENHREDAVSTKLEERSGNPPR